MNRRNALLACAGLLAGPLWAHSPYRQWVVFRQRFLLITTTRDDPGADDLGEEIARILLAALPESHAQVSRARDWRVLASLLTTAQTHCAVMSRARAEALFQGLPPYQDYGASPLRILVETPAYGLVCRDDFPSHHAYLLSEALMGEANLHGFSIPPEALAPPIPAHPGALALLRGEPPPAAPSPAPEDRRAQ